MSHIVIHSAPLWVVLSMVLSFVAILAGAIIYNRLTDWIWDRYQSKPLPEMEPALFFIGLITATLIAAPLLALWSSNMLAIIGLSLVWFVVFPCVFLMVTYAFEWVRSGGDL